MFFTLASFSLIAFVSIQTGTAKAYILQVVQEDPRDNFKKAIEGLSKNLAIKNRHLENHRLLNELIDKLFCQFDFEQIEYFHQQSQE